MQDHYSYFSPICILFIVDCLALAMGVRDWRVIETVQYYCQLQTAILKRYYLLHNISPFTKLYTNWQWSLIRRQTLAGLWWAALEVYISAKVIVH